MKLATTLKLLCACLALALVLSVPPGAGEAPTGSGAAALDAGGPAQRPLESGAVSAAFPAHAPSSAGQSAGATVARPLAGRESASAPAVQFMKRFIAQVNPSLLVEDPHCASALPEAIERHTGVRAEDWQRLFALAWQESSFDCHAKNRHDPGGAFGPFQIRRLWKPVTGDPRYRYFDPDLAVRRVLNVVDYYRDTARFAELVRRRFRNPLLCLYNSGESLRVNMRYCRTIGDKLERIQEAWQAFLQEDLRVQLGQGDAARNSG